MKKTQFIELLHNIGKTWVSFVSIMMFVALGVGLFLGIHWGAKAVDAATDNTASELSFHDFEITFPYGITDDNINDLKSIDGVTQAEGSYTAFATFSLQQQGHVTQIRSLTSAIDLPSCVEGTLPQQADEAGIDSAFAAQENIHVGDTITLDSDDASDPDGMKYLHGRTYKVTGLVHMANYLSALSSTRGMTNLPAGAADCFLILPTSAFDTAAYNGGYPMVDVRCASMDSLSTYSAAYTNISNTIKNHLTALGDVDGKARYETLRNALQTAIDDGQKKVDDGETQITDGEAKIADYESQITDYESQAASGEDKLSAAYDELEGYQEQADEKEAEFDSLIDSAASYLVGKGFPASQSDIASMMRADLEEAALSGEDATALARKHSIPETLVAPYADKINGAIDQYRSYLDKKEQLAEGWSTYYYWRSYLDDKEAQLEDGKAQLEDYKAQLEDGKTQLQNAKNQLAQLLEYSWNISDRASNTSVRTVSSYNDVTGRLRITMASLFLLVGLFVCYTAVSRIVSEQVVSIGTKKALGLRGREITISYLLYSAIAVIIGIAVGALAAVFIIEGILNATAASKFTIGAIPYYFSLLDTLQIGAVELALICLATWFACRRMLHRQAVDLLKGQEPPKNKVRFYEKWKAWDRLPLYSQSIVNNFFNDKLRVVGTLVGVAGCTALVVTAMTMFIDVQKTFDVQYQNVYAYDLRVSMTSSPTTDTALTKIADDAGAKSALVTQKTYAIYEPDGQTSAVTMRVPDDPTAFTQLFHLNSVNGGGQAQLDDSGVWVSEAYATHQKAKVGDTIKIADSSGVTHELPIAGIFEFHLNHHEVVMTKECYRNAFGQDPTINSLLVSSNGADTASLTSQFQQVDGFFSCTNDYNATRTQFQNFSSLTRTVVFIYLVLSALMALVVLLNLTVMFIEEKKRDLIVLMINGFSVKDAKRYIYRDNIALTVVGIILGILLGMLMGYLSMLSIEFDTDAYVLAVSWIACLTGVGASALFALIVNLIALRRIPAFKLTDINKM